MLRKQWPFLPFSTFSTVFLRLYHSPVAGFDHSVLQNISTYSCLRITVCWYVKVLCNMTYIDATQQNEYLLLVALFQPFCLDYTMVPLTGLVIYLHKNIPNILASRPRSDDLWGVHAVWVIEMLRNPRIFLVTIFPAIFYLGCIMVLLTDLVIYSN